MSTSEITTKLSADFARHTWSTFGKILGHATKWYVSSKAVDLASRKKDDNTASNPISKILDPFPKLNKTFAFGITEAATQNIPLLDPFDRLWNHSKLAAEKFLTPIIKLAVEPAVKYMKEDGYFPVKAAPCPAPAPCPVPLPCPTVEIPTWLETFGLEKVPSTLNNMLEGPTALLKTLGEQLDAVNPFAETPFMAAAGATGEQAKIFIKQAATAAASAANEGHKFANGHSTFEFAKAAGKKMANAVPLSTTGLNDPNSILGKIEALAPQAGELTAKTLKTGFNMVQQFTQKPTEVVKAISDTTGLPYHVVLAGVTGVGVLAYFGAYKLLQGGLQAINVQQNVAQSVNTSGNNLTVTINTPSTTTPGTEKPSLALK